jgi:hypothetical protein
MLEIGAMCGDASEQEEPTGSQSDPINGTRRDEEQLPSEEIGSSTPEQQKAAEHERVGIDDPLQARGREVQAALDRRQRHVHDRCFQDDHELRDADVTRTSQRLVFVLSVI